MFEEEDYLQLSGIQHFVFCKRQWALDHIEQQWKDNYLTLQGNLLHKKVDNPYEPESRKDRFVVRALPIHSSNLGLSGICDVVEFVLDDNKGIEVYGHKGKYVPIPVEYKHGKRKNDDSDKLQLLAEAICIEEMMFCRIEYGYLYYGQTRHREKVDFTSDLRDKLINVVAEMHNYWQKKYTPKVKPSRKCDQCSLKEICLPELLKRQSVSTYIKENICK